MLEKEAIGTVLIISHSGFISNIATIYLGLPIEENKNFKSDPCGINYFELDDNFKVKNYYINYTNHLLTR